MWRNNGTKYNAKKITSPDGVFDSKKEYRRWQELKMLERTGHITNLRRQVPFELIPAIREPDTVGKRGGIKKGRTIQTAVTYWADFVYWQGDQLVVEDSKGLQTDVFKLKKKLMLWRHGINIKIT